MIPSITEDDVKAALPNDGFLRRYVNYASCMTDAHVAYHLASGLAVIAQTCPVDYNVPFGSPMYSNIYALCVGRSSDARKSASIGVARDLLDAALPGSVGEVPGSKEALVDSLNKNPRQVIVYPEFGSFLSQTERGYLNPLKTAYTEAWDGSPLGRGLVKKTNTEAKFPRLSMMAGSTIEYLERHTEPADWTGGFMARFLTFYADRERSYSVPPGHPAGRQEMIGYIQWLASYGVFGVQRGQCLGFSPAARREWDHWYDSISSNKSTEETAGAIARSHSHALRVALLLSWDSGQARSGHDWYIDLPEMESAIKITKLHLHSVRRIGENLASSKDMRDRRIVYNSVGVNPVPLGQIVTSSRLLLRRVKEILESLCEEGVVRPITAPEYQGIWYSRTTMEERAAKFGGVIPEAIRAMDAGTEVPTPSNVIQFPQSRVSGASNITTGTGAPSVTTFPDPVDNGTGGVPGTQPGGGPLANGLSDTGEGAGFVVIDGVTVFT